MAVQYAPADNRPKTMYELTLRRISISLAAGDFFDIEEPHNYLMVEAGSNVELYLDAKPPKVEMPRGVGYQYPPDASVQRVRVLNAAAGTETITIYYGRGNIIDQRLTFSGGTVPTIETLPSAFNTNQVAVANAPVVVVAANAARRSVLIQAGTADLYVGNSNAVTTANGVLIPAGTAMTFFNPAVIYGIRTGAGAVNASFAEETL